MARKPGKGLSVAGNEPVNQLGHRRHTGYRLIGGLPPSALNCEGADPQNRTGAGVYLPGGTDQMHGAFKIGGRDFREPPAHGLGCCKVDSVAGRDAPVLGPRTAEGTVSVKKKHRAFCGRAGDHYGHHRQHAETAGSLGI